MGRGLRRGVYASHHHTQLSDVSEMCQGAPTPFLLQRGSGPGSVFRAYVTLVAIKTMKEIFRGSSMNAKASLCHS